MDLKKQIFMQVAENLSMSRVADEQFTTHQAVSQHIKKLEAEYGVLLFKRKPRLALTSAGEALLEMLYRIRTMENNIRTVLQEGASEGEIRGAVRLGVPESRYSVIVPQLLLRLKLLAPGIELKISSEYAEVLLAQVRKGLLDMAVIPQQERLGEAEMFPLLLDTQLLLVSDRMLRTVCRDEYPLCIDRMKRGIGIEDLARFPLVNMPPGSRAAQALSSCRTASGKKLRFVFESNHWDAFSQFARFHLAAVLISHMSFAPILQGNRTCSPDQFLHAFPVSAESIGMNTAVMLVCGREAYVPRHQLRVIEILKKMFRQYNAVLPYVRENYRRDPAFLRALKR